MIYIFSKNFQTSLLITLQNYGFSEKEAKVYLTVLELGTSIASTIARRSEIKRVTVYTILEDLRKKGYVNETSKDDIKYYSVISPDLLLKQLEQKYESFKEKVPELLALADKFGNRPKMQFFEGVSGIKHLYNELLKNTDPLFAFLSDDDITPELQEYLNIFFVKQRKQHNIHASVIVRDTPANENYIQSVKKDSLTDIRLMRDDLIGMQGELILFGEDKIACALYSPKELM